MICIVRNKSKFYKKILLDVWGQHFKNGKITKLIHFRRVLREQILMRKKFFRRNFVFSLAEKINFKKKKKRKKNYIRPKILYNYYFTLRRKNFRKLLFKAKRRYGFFEENYFTFIEGRLFMLVYRSNFVSNLFQLKFIINKGVFLVNGKKRYHSNFNVKIGEIVQVDFKYKDLVFNDMLVRFFRDIVNWAPGNYLFVNYKFLFVFFLRPPKKNDFAGYPIKLDPYIGADLYYL